MKQFLKAAIRHLGFDIRRVSPERDRRNRALQPFKKVRDLLGDQEHICIFDVGAHHGVVSRNLKSVFPSAAIHAFEPFSTSYDVLAAAFADDSRVKVYPFGFAETCGEREFQSNTFEQTNSLLRTDSRANQTWGDNLLTTRETVRAEFQTLDSFFAKNEIPSVELIKLDVQGAEPLVLEGARKTMGEGRIRMVYSEIIAMPTYENQQEIDETLRQFRLLGFELVDIYNPSYTDGGCLRQIDALFRHRRHS